MNSTSTNCPLLHYKLHPATATPNFTTSPPRLLSLFSHSHIFPRFVQAETISSFYLQLESTAKIIFPAHFNPFAKAETYLSHDCAQQCALCQFPHVLW